MASVRGHAAGFVDQVYVKEGQRVETGDLLLKLRNDALTAEYRELKIALEQGRVRHRMALDKHDAAAAQVASRNMQAATERLNDLQLRVEGLTIVAPVAGRIVARGLRQKIGTYIPEGSEILAIGNEHQKELILSVGQEEMEALVPLVGEVVSFRIGSRKVKIGTLQRLEPRASQELPHPAFSSIVGGPLAVKQGEQSHHSRIQLVEPRFRGVVALSPDAAADSGAGERGYARLGLRRESLGAYVWVRFSRWWESLLAPKIS